MLFKSKICSYIIVACFIVLIIVFPDISSHGVSRGLLISANIIIPSLFPFMVCILLLLRTGFSIRNRVINNVLYAIFGHDFNMFFVFLLSMLGGYPVGARLINEQYNQNLIDKRTADIMLMYCVNAGPAFVISVVGGGVFNSQKIGNILFLSHITASLVIAIFCNKALKKVNCQYKVSVKNVKTFSQNFVESVADASESIIKICSFILLFSSLNSYIDFFFSDVAIIKYISYFTEVTYAITKTKNIFFTAFLLGFSGISIWCQIFALSSGYRINFLRFVFGRILHGVISASITKILIDVCDIKITTFSNNISFKNDMLYSNTALFFAMLVMLIVLLTFIYTKNNSGKIVNDMI